MDTLLNFSLIELLFVGLIFVWTGFVRTGLGFGGAALGLPLLLFVHDEPIYWLPIIGLHLLFFSGLTLRNRLAHIDLPYIKKSTKFLLPSSLVGILGLISLPSDWLVIFIYSVSIFYAALWLTGHAVRSNNKWVDGVLLSVGGYVAGVSLTGAPLIVAVFMRNVAANMLRNTLFVLWFTIVSMKMLAFLALGVDIHAVASAALIPIAAIGHFLGLKAHSYILNNDALFKRITGAGLLIVSGLGLLKAIWL